MKPRTIIVSTLTASSLVISLFAAPADTPSVDSILDRNIAALGGKAALDKTTSRVVKYKMESEAFAPSEGELYAAAPNKQRVQTELKDVGTISEGFDGTVAWAKTPWEEGTRIKTGEELAKVKRDSEFHRDLKLKTIFPDLAFKGTEKVGDEEGYMLESKPSASSKERFVFSKKTGLLIRQESTFPGPQGEVSASLEPKDYKAFDGLKYPTQVKIKFSSSGQTFEMMMKVLEVKHNAPIDSSKFAKPAK